MTQLIQGSGGGKSGGGGGRSPVEQSDTLRSIEYAAATDLIGEGEIFGLVNGLKSVYLNEVPIQNADGSYNYADASCIFSVGEQNPPDPSLTASGVASGFNYRIEQQAQYTVPVNVEVRTTSPVERQITNPDVSVVTVTILLPALMYQNVENGDLTGWTVSFTIQVSANGGPFVYATSRTINEKASGAVKLSIPIAVKQFGQAPYTIRVQRGSADSTSAYIQNKTYWDSYTETVQGYFKYPRSARATVIVNAAHFSSVPARAYDVKLLIIQVPSNYNPTTRAYSGIWDGTFKPAWSDNPAWCFYDLVTNPIYGLGEWVKPEQIDKWELYKIGQYCDQLVPDGRGGWEPRFTCNVYMQTQADALQWLQDMASIMRAMTYYASNSIVLVQDAPASMSAVYTRSNVIDGEFVYSGTARKMRHTVALVAWNDPKDFYRQKLEYVEDREGVLRYGLRTTQIVAVGCTSQGQAHRAGLWLLYTERMETELVDFGVGLDTAPVRPGAICGVQNPKRAGLRLGGRVTSVAANAIGIDAPITIQSGKVYTLSTIAPSGDVVERTLNNTAGSASVLTFAAALPALPVVNSVWMVAVTDLVPELFRIMSIRERARHQFEVTGAQHNPSKYAAIELGLKLENPPVSVIPGRSQAPIGNLRFSEFLRKRADLLEIVLSIAWDAPAGATSYLVEYQLPNGNWVPLPEQSSISVDIPVALPGAHAARVVAINALGTKSTPISGNYTVLGEAAPPPALTTFLVSRQSDGTRQFTWSMLAPPVDYNGAAVIRYKLGAGATWETMAALHDGILTASPFETNQLAAGTYTFAAKAVDRTGNESAEAKYIEMSIGDPRLAGAIEILSERNDGWPGTKNNCHVEALSGSLTANDVAPNPWLRNWSGQWIGTPAGTIVYERTIDIGAVTAFTPLVTAASNGVNTITETHSNDNITYTAAAPTGLLITARYIKIRVQCAAAWPVLTDVTTILSAAPITEEIEDLNTANVTGVRRIGVGRIRLPLLKKYSVIKRVQAALQSVGGGWSWVLVDKKVNNLAYPVPSGYLSIDECIFSASDHGSLITVTDSVVENTADGGNAARAVVGKSSGKWYWEVEVVFNSVFEIRVGVANATASMEAELGVDANSWAFAPGQWTVPDPKKITNNTPVTYGQTVIGGDIVGVKLDMDAGSIEFLKNNVSMGVAFTGLTGTLFPAVSVLRGSMKLRGNFGKTSPQIRIYNGTTLADAVIDLSIGGL